MCLCFGFCAFFLELVCKSGPCGCRPRGVAGSVVVGSGRLCSGGESLSIHRHRDAPTPEPCVAREQSSLYLRVCPHARGRVEWG